jgi:hypothetical protein
LGIIEEAELDLVREIRVVSSRDFYRGDFPYDRFYRYSMQTRRVVGKQGNVVHSRRMMTAWAVILGLLGAWLFLVAFVKETLKTSGNLD